MTIRAHTLADLAEPAWRHGNPTARPVSPFAEDARRIIQCRDGKARDAMIHEASDDVLEEAIRILRQTKRRRVLLALVLGVYAGRFGK